MNSKTVIVIGAGIFGVTAALELCRRGWKVNLLDLRPIPNPIAQSSEKKLMVRLDYRTDEEYFSLVERSLDGWREWNRSWPEPFFHETGMLILKRNPMGEGEFEFESYHTLIKRGHLPVRLDAEAIQKKYPAWKPGQYVDGYFNPEGGFVEGGKALAQLLNIARSEGVSVCEGQAFACFTEQGSRVAGVVASDGSKFIGEKVIMAAGAWLPYLIPSLAPFFKPNGLPIFHLRPSNPELFRPEVFPTFTADITNTGYFGYPVHARDGLVVIGRQGRGRVIHPDGDRATTPAETALLRLFLAQAFPALFDAEIVSSSFGIFMETNGGHPWIGADPDREGVVIATGTDHAFKFAPMLGQIIADAIEERENPFLFKFRLRTEPQPDT